MLYSQCKSALSPLVATAFSNRMKSIQTRIIGVRHLGLINKSLAKRRVWTFSLCWDPSYYAVGRGCGPAISITQDFIQLSVQAPLGRVRGEARVIGNFILTWHMWLNDWWANQEQGGSPGVSSLWRRLHPAQGRSLAGLWGKHLVLTKCLPIAQSLPRREALSFPGWWWEK